MKKNDLYSIIENRRSIYTIGNKEITSKEKIEELVNRAIKNCPTAFNSQTGRVVILFGNHHKKLWDIVLETLRKVIPTDKFSPTEEKISSFAKGYGTLLFYEDTKTIKNLQENL